MESQNMLYMLFATQNWLLWLLSRATEKRSAYRQEMASLNLNEASAMDAKLVVLSGWEEQHTLCLLSITEITQSQGSEFMYVCG